MNRPALPRRLRAAPASLVVLSVLSLLPLAAAASPQMKDGGWEMKARILGRETPAGDYKLITESTSRFCLSKTFLAGNPYLTPGVDQDKMEKKGAKCTISDPQQGEKQASWKMSCTLPDGNTVDMQISNTVGTRTLTSEVDQVIRKGDQQMQMKISMKGRYAGACTSDMMSM